MSKRKMRWPLILASIGLGLAGCAITYPVAYIPHPLPDPVVVGEGEGAACDYGLFVFPPLIGSPQASLAQAMETAVKAKGGDAMINATIDYTEEFYFLMNIRCTHVKGTVVRTR